MEWYEVIKDLISSLGFPIFVSVYLLWENRTLTTTLTELKDALISLKEKLD